MRRQGSSRRPCADSVECERVRGASHRTRRKLFSQTRQDKGRRKGWGEAVQEVDLRETARSHWTLLVPARTLDFTWWTLESPRGFWVCESLLSPQFEGVLSCLPWLRIHVLGYDYQHYDFRKEKPIWVFNLAPNPKPPSQRPVLRDGSKQPWSCSPETSAGLPDVMWKCHPCILPEERMSKAGSIPPGPGHPELCCPVW